MFYYVTTYGCQMNVHESEKIAGQLEEMGYKPTDRAENADIVVFNTCTIRENAVAKAYGHIGNLKKLKKARKDMIIAVGGCMTQDEAQANDLVKKFPYIDVVFGTHNLSTLKELINRKLATKKRVIDIPKSEVGYDMEAPKCRTSYPNAWVNIMYGCNNFCSYCIVPYVRGRERSRPFCDIVKEVEDLLKEGYKEITLLGQNVNSYGNDLDDANATFPILMETLAKLPYKYRLRFMTSHPKDFSKELADVIAKYDNICKFIHIPCQSGSNGVLAAMNRRYTRESYLEKIAYVKKTVPNFALSTDIMVGFPGESEEDFLDTLDLVEKVRFSSAFMFEYSVRRGTKAAVMDDQVPEEVKTDRITRLIEKVNGISKEISNSFIGKTVEVLVEDHHDGVCLGRTDGGKMTSFPYDEGEKLIGQFVDVKVNSTTISALKGEFIKVN